MPETNVTPPSVLWKAMSEERRLEAARAFWLDEQSLAEQAEVVGMIARQINFRPKSVLALPVERRARHVARLTKLSEPVAARLLVAYHLAHQRPMMGAFLDALGIAHENGLIADENVGAPDPEKVREAARALSTQYPADNVRLYFDTLLVQDPDTWRALRDAFDAPAAL